MFAVASGRTNNESRLSSLTAQTSARFVRDLLGAPFRMLIGNGRPNHLLCLTPESLGHPQLLRDGHTAEPDEFAVVERGHVGKSRRASAPVQCHPKVVVDFVTCTPTFTTPGFGEIRIIRQGIMVGTGQT